MVDLTYQGSVQPDALPGRAYPRLPESVPEGAFGGEIGRGIENLGSVVQQHVDAAMSQARQTQLTDAHNQMQALSLRLTHDPQTGALTKQGKDALGLPQQYLPQFDAQAQKIVDAVPDPRARQAAGKAMLQTRNLLSEQLDTHEIDQTRQFDVKAATTSISLAQQAAQANYNHPDVIGLNLLHMDASLDSLAHQQGWGPEQLLEAKYEEHVKFHQGVLTSMLADKKPDLASAYLHTIGHELKPAELEEAQKAIRAGQSDAAVQPVIAAYGVGTRAGEKAMQAFAARTDLSADQKASATQEIERQRNAQIYQNAQKYDRQLTGLHTEIASGQPSPSASSRADWLYEHGALSQGQHIALLDSIQASQKKADADDGRLSFAQAAFTNETKLDPKDSKQTQPMNLLFQTMTAGQKPGSPAYVNTAASIASKTGVIPADVVGYARSNIMGGNPQDAAQAAQMLDRLRQSNPQAYGYAVQDKQLNAMVHTISSAVNAGTSPEVAATMARENAQRSEGDNKLLEQQWKRQIQATNAQAKQADAIRSGLSDDPDYEGTGLPFLKPGVPQPPTAMLAEFNDLSHEYFNHTGGNLQQARQLALSDMKQTWGVSQVNGSRELMKYAPERMFPGLTPEMIHADIASSVPHVDVEAQGKPKLIESPDTESSGGRVWNLGIKDEFGAYDIARDNKGNALRYQLPDVQAGAREAAQKQHEDDLKRLQHEQQLRAQEMDSAVLRIERH